MTDHEKAEMNRYIHKNCGMAWWQKPPLKFCPQCGGSLEATKDPRASYDFETSLHGQMWHKVFGNKPEL